MFLPRSGLQRSLGRPTFPSVRARPRAHSQGRACPARTESEADTEQTTHTIRWSEKPNFPREIIVPLAHMLWNSSRGRLERAEKAILHKSAHKLSNEPCSHLFSTCPAFPCMLQALNVCEGFARLLASKTELCCHPPSSTLGSTSSREELRFVPSLYVPA